MRFEERPRGWSEAASWTFRFPHAHSHPNPHPLNLAQRVLIRDISESGKEARGERGYTFNSQCWARALKT